MTLALRDNATLNLQQSMKSDASIPMKPLTTTQNRYSGMQSVALNAKSYSNTALINTTMTKTTMN